MTETILCYNCMECIKIEETDDYHEYGEDTTCGLVDCPNCGKTNAITYSYSVDFNGVEPDEQDLKDFE